MLHDLLVGFGMTIIACAIIVPIEESRSHRHRLKQEKINAERLEAMRESRRKRLLEAESPNTIW